MEDRRETAHQVVRPYFLHAERDSLLHQKMVSLVYQVNVEVSIVGKLFGGHDRDVFTAEVTEVFLILSGGNLVVSDYADTLAVLGVALGQH